MEPLTRKSLLVFLRAHDTITADELCDRVAFLVDGEITARESPRALRCGAIARHRTGSVSRTVVP